LNVDRDAIFLTERFSQVFGFGFRFRGFGNMSAIGDLVEQGSDYGFADRADNIARIRKSSCGIITRNIIEDQFLDALAFRAVDMSVGFSVHDGANWLPRKRKPVYYTQL
jgi:hypothetical protein